MAPIKTFSIFFIFFFLPHRTTSLETCKTSFCNGVKIKFPFRLTNSKTSTRCGYQGFNISCRNTQPILNFPESEPFSVRNIDYPSQNIWIYDSDNCMPQRFLNGFNVSGSPFQFELLVNFTFLNCSNSTAKKFYPYEGIYRNTIQCLSGYNYIVMAILTKYYEQYSMMTLSSCSVIQTVLIPISSPYDDSISSDLRLTWSKPNCGSCEERGESCGFKNETSSDVGCSNRHNGGIPRSAKYGMIMGVGIPGLVCLIGLSCYACSKVRDYTHRRRHPTTEFSISITPHPAVVMMGLDGSTIEKFPKTQLGESGRLPKPNDNVCPICLSEYQPKETLRTIPECNHYFHANCIDEWLKMNATCPLCRNSPEGSSIISSSSSFSLSSSQSSL